MTATNAYGWSKGPVLPLDAQRAYYQFMTHLTKCHAKGLKWPVNNFGEFGTGTSLAISFCALLSGARRYCGFDVLPLVEASVQSDLLDGIASLFRDRAFAKNDLGQNAIAFPQEILGDEVFNETLRPDFMERIRAEARAPSPFGDLIRYTAPYSHHLGGHGGSLDVIISTATMEHAENTGELYLEFYKMLQPGGVISHSIDLRSHGYTKPWNGETLWNSHWLLSDSEWADVTRGQDFSINRLPASMHIKMIVESGFNLLAVQKRKYKNDLVRYNLASRFQWMTPEDIECSGLHVIARRR